MGALGLFAMRTPAAAAGLMIFKPRLSLRIDFAPLVFLPKSAGFPVFPKSPETFLIATRNIPERRPTVVEYRLINRSPAAR